MPVHFVYACLDAVLQLILVMFRVLWMKKIISRLFFILFYFQDDKVIYSKVEYFV